MSELTHFDSAGAARMVDVGEKIATRRLAVATGRIKMQPATLQTILSKTHAKGDVLQVARLAGIMGAKRTADLIPLCHPLALTSVTVDLSAEGDDGVAVTAVCKVAGPTGVEMEALTAVSVACLTVYDMCKGLDRGMKIEAIQLEEKAGGASGHWVRQPDSP